MISLLTELLGNQYVIGTLGALLTLVFVYFKGKNTARKENEAEQAQAKEKQGEALHKAEADNHKEDGKREETLHAIDSTAGIEQLIKLFNALKRPPEDR